MQLLDDDEALDLLGGFRPGLEPCFDGPGTDGFDVGYSSNASEVVLPDRRHADERFVRTCEAQPVRVSCLFRAIPPCLVDLSLFFALRASKKRQIHFGRKRFVYL